MDKLDFIGELKAIGVEFSASFPAPGGSHSISLSPKQLLEYSKNPNLYTAKQCGVTLSEYLQWKEEGFSVQCSANTAKGKRCKNIVTGGSMVMPLVWASLTGNYCDKHENG